MSQNAQIEDSALAPVTGRVRDLRQDESIKKADQSSCCAVVGRLNVSESAVRDEWSFYLNFWRLL